MKHTPLTLTGLLRAALALLCSATFAHSAISFTDIRLWAGAAPGEGISEAALVVDFRDGQPGLIWGYRWPAQESRTGQDMLAAILGADNSLNVDSTFFPNSFSYGARARSFSNNGTPENYFDDSYWGYWVNNEVYYHPTNFLLNSHIVPPATEVAPLGSPYGPGYWVESSTGAAARPLVHGSWDGWAYGVFGTQAGEPVAAIPEPGAALLLATGIMFLSGRRRIMIAAAGCLTSTAWAAGPYPSGPMEPGSDAIPAASALYIGWAAGVSSFQPGPRQAGTASSAVSYGSAGSVTGPPDAAGATYPPVSNNPVPAAPVLSLGDGGRVTLTFSPPIANGEGADFAVFENGFATGTAVFAELAFVEVSSNGMDFVRFPAVSCTPVATQTGTFGTLDPRNLHNLAGKYPAGYGTPFDLSELAAAPGLNIRRITHVRLVDVVGDVISDRGSRDSIGNWINDPFPTTFQTGGFDLDAVGVIHEADEPLPHLDLAVYTNNVVLTFTRDASWTDIVLALQQSSSGQEWTPLAVSSNGGGTVPAAGAEVAEAGSSSILVTVTAPRTADRQIYRLSLQRTP